MTSIERDLNSRVVQLFEDIDKENYSAVLTTVESLGSFFPQEQFEMIMDNLVLFKTMKDLVNRIKLPTSIQTSNQSEAIKGIKSLLIKNLIKDPILLAASTFTYRENWGSYPFILVVWKTLVHNIVFKCFEDKEKKYSFLMKVFFPAFVNLLNGEPLKMEQVIKILISELRKKSNNEEIKDLELLLPVINQPTILRRAIGSFIPHYVHNLEKFYKDLLRNKSLNNTICASYLSQIKPLEPNYKAYDKLMLDMRKIIYAQKNSNSFNFLLYSFQRKVMADTKLFKIIYNMVEPTSFTRLKEEVIYLIEDLNLSKKSFEMELYFWVFNLTENLEALEIEWNNFKKLHPKIPFNKFLSDKLLEFRDKVNRNDEGALKQLRSINSPEFDITHQYFKDAIAAANQWTSMIRTVWEPFIIAGDIHQLDDLEGLDGKPHFGSIPTHVKEKRKITDRGDSKGVDSSPETSSSETVFEEEEVEEFSEFVESPVVASATAGSAPDDSLKSIKLFIRSIIEALQKELPESASGYIAEAENHVNNLIALLRRLEGEKDRAFPCVTSILGEAFLAIEQLLKAHYVGQKKSTGDGEEVLVSHNLRFIADQLPDLEGRVRSFLLSLNRAEINARFVEVFTNFSFHGMTSSEKLLHKASTVSFDQYEKEFGKFLNQFFEAFASLGNKGIEFARVKGVLNQYLKSGTKRESPKPRETELAKEAQSLGKLLSSIPQEESTALYMANFQRNLLLRFNAEACRVPEPEEMQIHFTTIFLSFPWIFDNLMHIIFAKKGRVDVVDFQHNFSAMIESVGLKIKLEKEEIDFLGRIQFYRNLRYKETQKNKMVDHLAGLIQRVQGEKFEETLPGYEFPASSANAGFRELEGMATHDLRIMSGLISKMIDALKP